GLKPRTVYWYRFTDEHGFGSRIGRTITAPAIGDARPASFAFVSCQMVPAGACNAYRRMIWEDEQKPFDDQLGFVLHLGDFVYEVVWYPEDRAQYYARKLRDVVRYPQGDKVRDFHVPSTVADYRALYRAYLLDPDLQDARARWPFVCMWDNHEFSWKGWQSQQDFSGVRPAQTRKVAANQAWFEYQPARVVKRNPGVDVYIPPAVANEPIRAFDDHGLGLEPGNLAAIGSLKLYRTLRWGANVELLLTDNRSFRSEPVMHQSEAAQFLPEELALPWPDDGYAQLIDDDWSAYRHERAEILAFLRRERITGVATICGDRHSFSAGTVSPAMPPKTFDPVIAEFITASISAPGLFEAAEYNLA